MRPLFFILIFGVLGMLAVACLPVASSSEPPPTDTPSPPTQTPSPTIIWFPPTATLTPLPMASPSISPTLNTQPEYGELIFEDDFSDAAAWMTGNTGSGSISSGKNELTLAVKRPNGYLYSLLTGIRPANFYAEVTASPTLCRDGDEYGILLRFTSEADFYRFSLTCNGQVRLDKLYQGKASSPQSLTPSGAVPRGAPSSSRLAVLADGRDLQFYVNDEYQFSVRDPSLTAGNLGVFARAEGDGAVTVNFSDLKVYQVGGN